MTYTQQMRARYAALITLSRRWRHDYLTLRAHGFDRTQACELANLSVGIDLHEVK